MALISNKKLEITADYDKRPNQHVYLASAGGVHPFLSMGIPWRSLNSIIYVCLSAYS
jgi:hypothetical protein